VVFIGLMMTVEELVFGRGGMGGGQPGAEGDRGSAERAKSSLANFRPPLTLRMAYGEDEDPLGLWVLAQAALGHLTGQVPAVEGLGADPAVGPASPGAGLAPIAGLPRFPRLFARDALVSVLLMENLEAPLDLLMLLGQLQGTGANATSGMELGKVGPRAGLDAFLPKFSG
jgi:hypothetical protein